MTLAGARIGADCGCSRCSTGGPSIVGKLFQTLCADLLAKSIQRVQMAEDELGGDSTHVEF